MGFTIKDYDLRKTFITEKKMLLFAGIYPRKTTKYWYLYLLGAFANVLFSLGQILTMTIQMTIDRNDLSKLSEALQYFTTLMTYVCKFTNFVYYRKNLLFIEDMLTTSTFYGFSDDRLKIVEQKIDSAKNVGRVFRFFCVLAWAFFGIVPLFDHGRNTLPIPGWFPYNVTKHYYCTWTFQTLGIANTAYTNSAIDILTWMLISIATAQFNILKENLKNIDWMDKDLKSTERNLTDCVKHHKEIVKFVYKIENTFSKGIFLQFFASVIIICFTGFSMIIVPLKSVRFVFLVMYFCCMMCQVAMYCWYGHDVMTTSNKITEFFYISNWYESDLKIRKNILIFLERTKRPVTLTAGGFVTLSLTTLTSILRSAYSYFAVLRRLYSDF